MDEPNWIDELEEAGLPLNDEERQQETEEEVSDEPTAAIAVLDRETLERRDPHRTPITSREMAERFGLERTLPHSLEAERGLIAAVLRDNTALDLKEVARLKPEDFFRDAHRLIFQAMRTLREKGREIDFVTLVYQLGQVGEVDECGGEPYLKSLLDEPVAPAVGDHAKIILETKKVRDLIFTLNRGLSRAYENEVSPREMLNEALLGIWALADDGSLEGPVPARKLAEESVALVRLAHERKQIITGVPSGFVDLDEVTAGFQKSDLVIVGGRPSMGKSALLLNIALYAATHKFQVLFFSLEMSRESVMLRLLSGEAGIDNHRLRTGFLGEKDLMKLNRVLETISESLLFIDDAGKLTVEEIWARARRQQNLAGLDLLIVDHAQLIDTPVLGDGKNRHLELSQAVKGLKRIAKDLRVPVILISQLSRELEKRRDKRPRPSDLRESGTFEEVADMILFVYRDEHYSQTEENTGIAEIIVAKNRNGPTATVNLAFLRELTRFENLAWGRSDESPRRSAGPLFETEHGK